MIVGEAPGEKEVELRRPFVGTSGWLLDTALQEAGLHRSQAFLTNVLRERPGGDRAELFFPTRVKDRSPDARFLDGKWAEPPAIAGRDMLRQELLLCRPTTVIALGNVALWALTGLWGIKKWRSSILEAEWGGHTFRVIPAYHPAAVLREWPLRPIFVHDLKRAARELRSPTPIPTYEGFIVRPTFQQAEDTLRMIGTALEECEKAGGAPIPLSADIETRAGHIACIGIAWSAAKALCLPWMCVERPEGYWTLEEELVLTRLVRAVLSHPHASVTWQNGAYDHQYEYRWHFYLPQLGWDTMLAHHAMFSTSLKSLDHLSSLYCSYHRYWKEDGRNWDPATMPEEQYWRYNCEDAVRTFEIRERQHEAIAALAPTWPKLPAVVAFQHQIQPIVVRMMLRGVRSDDTARDRMRRALRARVAEIESEVAHVVGRALNPKSPKQITSFFYEELNQTPIWKTVVRANGSREKALTSDDDALTTIAGRQPVLRPLAERILALRSAGVFLSTFVEMARDTDGRLRCSYNVAGTKTYRFSSSENAFGSGGNLQNIPTGDEEEDAVIALPNIRELFLFDPGYTGFDIDGDSADLRIVTGESGCRAMQAYFAARVKPYVEIAKEYYRDPTLTKESFVYRKMKALCHGTNYGGESVGLAERVGLLVHEVERMQKWYFGLCPEIKAWQADIAAQGERRGWIENPFGQRLYNFDRWSRKIKNEFLAWTPQSSVGQWINRVLVALDRLPGVELLLQVHDSATGQWRGNDPAMAERMRAAATFPIQCKHELVTIPVGIKTSTESWGKCK